jgi:hypothetical protein
VSLTFVVSLTISRPLSRSKCEHVRTCSAVHSGRRGGTRGTRGRGTEHRMPLSSLSPRNREYRMVPRFRWCSPTKVPLHFCDLWSKMEILTYSLLPTSKLRDTTTTFKDKRGRQDSLFCGRRRSWAGFQAFQKA